MDEAPPPLPPTSPAKARSPAGQIARLLLGIVVANLAGGALYLGVSWYVRNHPNSSGAVAIPSLFLVPFFMGLLAAWCWQPLRLTFTGSLMNSLGVALLALAASSIVLREGIVCMVMASPALYVMIAAGALVGRLSFQPKDSTRQLCILPLLAVMTAGETLHRTDRESVVIDKLHINAPPGQVWPHVLAFPEIPDPADYWIFKLGLPYPSKTANGGNFVGADRQCIFSDGIVIKERVAEFVPNEKLTFDIVEQPTHPEAYGHITLHRGQFILRDNQDGTTTLIGSSWYTLHVRPAWYFELWTRDMTREVHLRVMRHIKRLSEA